MMRLTYGHARNLAVGAWALSAALMLQPRQQPPTPRRRRRLPGHRADLPARNAKRATARFDGADVAHDIHRGAAVGVSIRPRRRSPDAAVAIDRPVGIQKFKNDRSLTDDQVETYRPLVTPVRRRANAKDMPAANLPDGQGWTSRRSSAEKKADLIISP